MTPRRWYERIIYYGWWRERVGHHRGSTWTEHVHDHCACVTPPPARPIGFQPPRSR